MSIFNYLFDSEWRQRDDIDSLRDYNKIMRGTMRRRRIEADEQRSRIEELEREVDELALVNKTLLRLVVAKKICTAQELAQLMTSIDWEDGVEDGRLSKETADDDGDRLPDIQE